MGVELENLPLNTVYEYYRKYPGKIQWKHKKYIKNFVSNKFVILFEMLRNKRT